MTETFLRRHFGREGRFRSVAGSVHNALVAHWKSVRRSRTSSSRVANGSDSFSGDPGLKLLEHADFFTRALGVLATVHNPELKCFHARTPFNADYMQRRRDLAASGEIPAERYENG